MNLLLLTLLVAVLGPLAQSQELPLTRVDDAQLAHQAFLAARDGQFDKAIQEYGVLLSRAKITTDMVPAIGAAALRTRLPDTITADQQELFFQAGKAELYSMAGDLKTAGQTLDEMVERLPDAPNVHYLYGMCILQSDPDRAIEEFRRELTIAPANAQTGAMLAWVLFLRHEYTSALPYAQHAIKSDPTLALAQMIYGRLLVETGAVERGIGHLEVAEKLDPGNLEEHLALVTAYSRCGRTRDARRERQLSLALRKAMLGGR